MSSAAPRPRVTVFSLGGTISMEGAAGSGVVPKLDANDLLAGIPQLAAVAQVTGESVSKAASVELGFADVAALAERIAAAVAGGADGVVVTQGTDTLEETAYLLDLLLDLDEPVVVTGAMRDPTKPGADGPANLAAAIRVAASPAARGLGVVAVMNDEVHAARFVAKRHTHKTSAFGSGTIGPLGWVVEDRVRIALRPAQRAPTIAWKGPPPRVILLPMVFGGDAQALRDLTREPVAGMVVEAVGGGHVPSAMVEPLAQLAATAPVVLASRTGGGETLDKTYGYAGGEIDLLGRGLIGAGLLDARKARLLLSLLLGAGATREEIAAAFVRASA